jgi:hypothetical protein
MLRKDLWRQHEPRFGFFLFKEFTTRMSFSIRPDFKALTLIGAARLAKSVWVTQRKLNWQAGLKESWRIASEYGPVVLSRDRDRLRFRVVVTTREGRLLAEHQVPGAFPPGGSVEIDFDAVLVQLGLPRADYIAIVIMSRGRPDGFRSSPGSYSMTYYNDRIYTTYRTGGFARALNDPKRKKHGGFRGINPKVLVNANHLSSLGLINHSSDPQYNETARPRTVLLRADGKTMEADFGEIPAFGGLVRSMEDLFGPSVREFLESAGGLGTTITTCPGITLASLHLCAARDGSSLALEHSRPTHTYLINAAV